MKTELILFYPVLYQITSHPAAGKEAILSKTVAVKILRRLQILLTSCTNLTVLTYI
jgi:hypothetical protein